MISCSLSKSAVFQLSYIPRFSVRFFPRVPLAKLLLFLFQYLLKRRRRRKWRVFFQSLFVNFLRFGVSLAFAASCCRLPSRLSFLALSASLTPLVLFSSSSSSLSFSKRLNAGVSSSCSFSKRHPSRRGSNRTLTSSS